MAEKAREGVYLGLDEELYHADPALGSSSIKALAWSPADYWFNSPHNKLKTEKKDTEAQMLGRAFHKLVLEGREALEAKFACKQTENWSTKEGRAEKEDFAARGLTGLKFDDWSRILISGESIFKNPYLQDAFIGGPTEVSIFWERGGVRRKARIDCLKLRSNTDLKTISPDAGIPFDEACLRHMARYHYHVQAQHYNEGRAMIAGFMKRGLVFGSHSPEFLEKVSAQASWASVFVFLKKTDAPLSWGTVISMRQGPDDDGNPLLEAAADTIDRACKTYAAYRDKFGLDTPWMDHKPMRELSADDLPAWFRGI